MDNFVPLVVPGLSSPSSSSSASTSRPKNQSNSSRKSETSSDPVTTRSAKRACGKPMQTSPDKRASENRGPAHEKDEMNKEDPTQDIPDLLQPFTDNWEDLGTHVSAHSSEREISDSESDASKVVTQKKKHRIHTHFPKDRNCDRCLRTKITRVPCRRRDEVSIPRAEKFGDLITVDHKVLNEGSESRNNHRDAVVVQDLATQWIQSYPCKNKNSQETEKSRRKFQEPSQKPKVIETDNSVGIWQILWRIIMESSNIHASSLRNKRNCRTSYTTSKSREHQPCYCNPDWMIRWWSDSMECNCYLRNVQDLLADGKTPVWTKFWGIISRTNYFIWCTGGIISQTLREKQSENSSIREESITKNFCRMCFDRGCNLERRHSSDCWYWRIGKVWCIGNISQKTECKRCPDNPKRRIICISCGRWFSKIISERRQIPRTHTKTGIHRKETESQRRISRRQGRVSTWRNKKWRRSP